MNIRRRFISAGIVLGLLAVPTQGEAPNDGPRPQRIIGGRPVTDPDEMPFAVFVDQGNSFCSGSVVAPRWILTAAHCVVRGDGSIWQPGDIEVQKRSPNESEYRDVVEVRVAPNYVYAGAGFENDLALLRISHPFTAREGGIVPLVDLEQESLHSPSGSLSTMAGYGRRENDAWSDGLRRADSRMFTPEECRRRFSLRDEEAIVYERTLCFGSSTTRMNSGDSGGPLLIETRDGWVQIGVHSMTGWDDAGNPVVSIATRVASLHDWIVDQLEFRLHFAHYVAGEGSDTDLVLANPSRSHSVSGNIRFFGPEGQDQSLSLVPEESLQFVLPPLGTHAVSPTSDVGGLLVGGAQVKSDGELTGFVRFRLDGVGMTSVGASRPALQALIPVSGGDIRTGIAVYNSTEEAAPVRWYLISPSGERVRQSEDMEVPKFGHMARFLDEVFTEDGPGFQGSVLVESWRVVVSVLGIELGSGAGELATLPVSVIRE